MDETKWISELVGDSLLTLCDVIIDIQQEQQLVGEHVFLIQLTVRTDVFSEVFAAAKHLTDKVLLCVTMPFDLHEFLRNAGAIGAGPAP